VELAVVMVLLQLEQLQHSTLLLQHPMVLAELAVVGKVHHQQQMEMDQLVTTE
jgi:hypothetical protein